MFSLFFIVVILLGWVFSYVFSSPSILWFAIIFSIVMNFFSYWYSDKVVLAITGARLIEKKNSPELYNLVENLCITAGLSAPKIYLVPEAAPNAFATGRDPKHAVIAVTQGLLERLDRTELEGVIAHELSHIGNRDILISTIAVVLVGFVALLSDMFIRSLWFGRGFRRNRNESGSLFLFLGIILSVLAPVSVSLIQLAISRKREFLADASGALLTRYPEGLASALEKISGDPTPLRRANQALAHLWVSDPNKKKTPLALKLFMTHPPVEERIKRLREMAV